MKSKVLAGISFLPSFKKIGSATLSANCQGHEPARDTGGRGGGNF